MDNPPPWLRERRRLAVAFVVTLVAVPVLLFENLRSDSADSSPTTDAPVVMTFPTSSRPETGPARGISVVTSSTTSSTRPLTTTTTTTTRPLPTTRPTTTTTSDPSPSTVPAGAPVTTTAAP